MSEQISGLSYGGRCLSAQYGWPQQADVVVSVESLAGCFKPEEVKATSFGYVDSISAVANTVQQKSGSVTVGFDWLLDASKKVR